MTESPRSPIQSLFATLARGKPLAILGAQALAGPEGIKEAYLRKLAKHPPHEDPAAFRRIRHAYETLSIPGAFEAASLTAPPDLGLLRETFVWPLEEAMREAREGALASPDALQTGNPCDRWGCRSWADVSSGRS